MTMTMTANDILQHSPLILYLIAVTALSIHLLPRPGPYSARSVLFLLLAVVSLLLTWTHMIRFLFRSYADALFDAGGSPAYTTTVWLQETSLFDQAWRYVCATPERWWISAQLCTFTTGLWTVFLFAEASRRPDLRNRAWQYMVLGQIVAISFASSLFLALLSLPAVAGSSKARPAAGRSSGNRGAGPSRLLEGSVLFAFLTIALVPNTLSGTGTGAYGLPFLPNLLAMHAVILLPLAQVARRSSDSTSEAQVQARTSHRLRHSRLPSMSSALAGKHDSPSSFKPLYLAVAAASLALQVKHSLPLLAHPRFSLRWLAETLQETVQSYPAQSSISWDVICTNAIWQTWAALEIWGFWRDGRISGRKALAAINVVGLTPTLGSATSIGLVLAWREDWLQEATGHVKAD